ncbi:MAG TPA: dihydrofolate reductase [Candidatus Pacearchaeota archaeon]|nr:dihydrofolate reductase [Candidatus Pacearchaeota archaeon]
MKRFKSLTLNHPVIMGRRTYESLPEKFRPLPERKNIVLSNKLEEHNGIYIARSIEQAIDFTENQDSFVIGGGEIYKKFMPFVNKLEITRVYQNPVGDTFFPEINLDEWNLVNEEKKDFYSFLTYLRKNRTI